MIKKVLTVSAVTAMLLLSGCNNDAEDRMSVQQDLDSGNYDSVISYLEGTDIEDMNDDEKLKLATAFMGRAGFSVTDLITLVSPDEGEADASFETFIAGVDSGKSDTAIEDLQSAIDYYSVISSVKDSDLFSLAPSLASETPDLSEIDSNKLFLGLAYITKVATVFGYFGNVQTWNKDGSDKDLSASACAMVYLYENTLANGCDSVVVYDDGTAIDGVNYQNVDVTFEGTLYNRLANSDASELVLTDYDTNEPVQDDQLTVKEALIESLNLGFKAVEDAAPDDVKDKITEYKDKIDADANGVITVSEFALYIDDAMN